MNRYDETLYAELVDERENEFGWFRTPPARSSPDMIDLVIRVLAAQQNREQEKKSLRNRCRSVPEDRHPLLGAVA